MTKYRRIRSEEIPQCKEYWREFTEYVGVESAEPNWESLWVREDHGAITGFVGFQQRAIVEPFWASNPKAAAGLIEWADGALSSYTRYEFVVPNANKKFQDALERHYGIRGQEHPPHKYYIIYR